MSKVGQDWVDAHVCPWIDWTTKSRVTAKRMCMYNLTEESIELFALKMTDNGIDGDPTKLLLTQLCNGESQCKKHTNMLPNLYTTTTKRPIGFNKESNTDFVWGKDAVTDYVTIKYSPDKGKTTTGCLKIVNLNQSIVKVDDAQNIESGYTVLANNDAILKVSGACQELADLTTANYPAAFKTSLPISWQVAAKAYAKTCAGRNDESAISLLDNNKASVAKILVSLYDNLKKSMPVMMGYRYQREVLDMLTNRKGNVLTNYKSKKSNFTARALPILDMKQLKDMFRKCLDIQRFYDL